MKNTEDRKTAAPSFSAFTRRAVREDGARFAAVAALAFALRSAFGFALGYGSVHASLAALILTVLAALLSTGLFRAPPPAAEAPGIRLPDSLVFALPVACYSLLALADSLFLGGGAASPWALLVILPSCFDYGSSSLFAAAVPAAIGIAEAAGAFSPTPRKGEALTIGLALLASALVRGARRKTLTRDYRDDVERRDRERSISALRDAEVEIAARIQRVLLLERPAGIGSDLALEAITIASNAVDGDFYAFIPYTGASVDVLVGDVMGKGIQAALLGAGLKGSFLRSSLRLLVDGRPSLPRPAALVTAAHEAVVPELMDLESFATLQYARIDALGSRMDFVDCGHTPILHYDSVLNLCWSVKGTDLPLGFSEGKDYNEYSLPIAPGDRILFYSDGITEVPNGEGEFFGEKRLSSILAANATLEPDELVRRILNTAMFFSSENDFKDDVTCVALSVRAVAARPLRYSQDFPMAVDSLPAIRRFLGERLQGKDEGFVSRVILATEEAAENAINHGSTISGAREPPAGEAYDEEAGLIPEADTVFEGPAGTMARGFLRLEYVGTALWTSTRIVYRGTAFPWHRTPASPPVEGLPSGGSGISIMAAIADSVLFAKGPGDLKLACAFFEEGSAAV